MKKALYLMICMTLPCMAQTPSLCVGMDINPSVNVKLEPVEVKYNYSVDLMGLTSYAKSLDKSQLDTSERDVGDQKNAIIRGLTHSSMTYRVDVNNAYRDNGDGTFCIIPSEVNITLKWKPFVVFIESEFEDGSCQRNALLEHENKHVKIMVSRSVKYKDIFKQDVSQMIAQNYPALSRTKGNEEVMAAVENVVKYDMGIMNEEMDKYHSQLDSPSSLKYTHDECDSWYIPSGMEDSGNFSF